MRKAQQSFRSALVFSGLLITPVIGRAPEGVGNRSAEFLDARKYVLEQPRTFDNEIYFVRIGEDVVRAGRFTEQSALFGDFDGDGDVDRYDYIAFEICLSFSGPNLTIPTACEVFDADGDVDVDLIDVSAFAAASTGPLGTVMVDAGNLYPVRSVTGSYFSGDPFGTASTGGPSNFLLGIARQGGYTQDDLWYEWSVVSQPPISGAILLRSPSLPECPYFIGAPAVAGPYLFQLEVTNLVTGEAASDQVTLEMIDVAELRLAGNAPSRRVVLAGESITLDLEYKSTSTITFNVYGKQGDLTIGANQVLLGTVRDLPTTNGTWQPVAFTVDSSVVRTSGDLQAVAELDLGFNSLDTVGVLPCCSSTTQLAKSAAAEPIANHRNAIVTIGAARTETHIAAVEVGSPDVPKNPAGIDLDDQIGTPVGLGTANDVQALNTTNVIYPGIGPSGTVAGTDGSDFDHVARTIRLGHDINGDGLTDIVFGDGMGIEVLFGSPSINSAGGVATGDGSGAAGLAPNADAPWNQDWQNPGAFAQGFRGQFAIANLIALNIGDFNNDGQPDLATIDGHAGAVNNVRIVLLSDSVTAVEDPFLGAFNRTWTSTENGAGSGGGVGVGDFDGDGVVDAGFGMPAEDLANGGGNDEGVVVVIYGGADTTLALGSAFPATGTIAAVFENTPNGYVSRGTAAMNGLWGGNLIMGDVRGADTADLIFFKRLSTSQEINVIAGSSLGVDPADPADDTANVQINEASNNDFAGGFLTTGFVTFGASKADLIVGLPGLDTGSSATGVNEGAVYVIPSGSLPGAATAINALANTVFILNLRTGATTPDDSQLGFGTGVASLDYNGDGDEDLIIGQDATDGDFIYVYYGPLPVSGRNFNDTANSADLFLAAANGEAPGFEGFWLADINGDTIEDFVMAGTNWLGFMAGLETSPEP